MGETFITAVTKIEGIVEKRKEALKQIAGLLSEAIIGRSKDGKATVTNIETDIKKSIGSLTEEEQIQVLTSTVAYLATNGTFSNARQSSNKYQEKNSFSSEKKRKSAEDLFSRSSDRFTF